MIEFTVQEPELLTCGWLLSEVNRCYADFLVKTGQKSKKLIVGIKTVQKISPLD